MHTPGIAGAAAALCVVLVTLQSAPLAAAEAGANAALCSFKAPGIVGFFAESRAGSKQGVTLEECAALCESWKELKTKGRQNLACDFYQYNYGDKECLVESGGHVVYVALWLGEHHYGATAKVCGLGSGRGRREVKSARGWQRDCTATNTTTTTTTTTTTATTAAAHGCVRPDGCLTAAAARPGGCLTAAADDCSGVNTGHTVFEATDDNIFCAAKLLCAGAAGVHDPAEFGRLYGGDGNVVVLKLDIEGEFSSTKLRSLEPMFAKLLLTAFQKAEPLITDTDISVSYDEVGHDNPPRTGYKHGGVFNAALSAAAFSGAGTTGRHATITDFYNEAYAARITIGQHLSANLGWRSLRSRVTFDTNYTESHPIDACTLSGFAEAVPPACWDTSRVTNMDYLFANVCRDFDENIDSWETSAVTSMKMMFRRAKAFNQNINSWKTSAVTSLVGLFSSTDSKDTSDTRGWFWTKKFLAFNQPLRAWQTNSVVDMHGAFVGAVEFNQNIDSWRVGLVTGIGAMFRGARKFNQNLKSWSCQWSTAPDVSRDLGEMFEGAGCTAQECRLGKDCSVPFQIAYTSNGGWVKEVRNSYCPCPNPTTTSCTNTTTTTLETTLVHGTGTTVQHAGKVYGTLAGVAVDGTDILCQWEEYLPLPAGAGAGCVLAPDTPDVRANVVAKHTWSTSVVVLASGIGIRTKAWGPPGDPHGSGWLVASGGTYKVNTCNLQVLYECDPRPYNPGPLTWQTTRELASQKGSCNLGGFADAPPPACWDTSRVTNMDYLFANVCRDFNENIGSWETSAVTSMQMLFWSNLPFNQNIDAWQQQFLGHFAGAWEP